MYFNKKTLTRQAIVAALYTVMTLAIPALSYGPVQFRISEILTLLAFFNPEYIIGLTLGCAIANIFSTLGLLDVIIGTAASLFALTAMSKIKNIWIASLMPTLFCVFIGLEIMIVSPVPISFFIITGQIMLSEFVIVTILGVPIFKTLMKNKEFARLIV